jgi:hypothetical protein
MNEKMYGSELEHECDGTLLGKFAGEFVPCAVRPLGVYDRCADGPIEGVPAADMQVASQWRY